MNRTSLKIIFGFGYSVALVADAVLLALRADLRPAEVYDRPAEQIDPADHDASIAGDAVHDRAGYSQWSELRLGAGGLRCHYPGEHHP